MAQNEFKVKNKKVKEIFKNMEYDETSTEGCDLAWAWLKQKEYKFLTPSCTTKHDVKINEDVNIEVSGITNEDFEKMVTDSQGSLKEWTNLDGLQKTKLFNKLTAEIERYSPLICQLEMIIRNILSKDTKSKSIPMMIDYLQYYAGWACIRDKKLPDYEPYGICGYMILQNMPLALLTSVIAPALAAGNVVIIYSCISLAPIVFLFEQLCENVGFPKGVIKINTANSMQNYIFKHKSINKISYIGNLNPEENLVLPETKSLTTLHFGYSPMLVFDTADLDSTCDTVIDAVWGCRGLLPWTITKLLVQETIFDTFLEKLKTKLSKLSVGQDAMLKKSDIIILTKETVKNCLEINNVRLIIGNENIGGNILGNNYDNTPVVLPFRTATEASVLANNTKFGLAASVWTENINLANEIASKLKVGTIWINSHGYISANTSFCAMKKSGKGYFGGKEGLMEYLQSRKTQQKVNKQTKETNITSLLPGPINKKRLYLYYGGAFKKSESGLTEDYAEYPNKKDVRNCVETALKAQNSWGKLPSKSRSQALQKLANNTEAIQNSNITTIWIDILYEWATIGTSIVTSNASSPVLTAVKEPLGVVAFELHQNPDISVLKLIISAVAVGNSVIIINKCNEGMEYFLNEVCSKCNLPAGVFNVINNTNNEVIKTIMGHQEIQTYFKAAEDDENISCVHNICNIRNVNMDSNEDILNIVTKTKCIWSSIGESFM